MDNWLILFTFYHGLTPTTNDHLDAAAKGTLFSLTATQATELIENMRVESRSFQTHLEGSAHKGKRKGKRLRTSAVKRQPQHEETFASSSPR